MTHQSQSNMSHLFELPEEKSVDLTPVFAGVIATAAVELAGTAWAKKNSAVITEACRIDATVN